MNPSLETLEERILPAVNFEYATGGVLAIYSDPHGVVNVVADNQHVFVNGQTFDLHNVKSIIGTPITSVVGLYFSLQADQCTLINESSLLTEVLLGYGRSTIYTGTGPNLVRVPYGIKNHGFDAVDARNASVAAVDIRGGPGLVIGNHNLAVAADNAAQVFRILETL